MSGNNLELVVAGGASGEGFQRASIAVEFNKRGNQVLNGSEIPPAKATPNDSGVDPYVDGRRFSSPSRSHSALHHSSASTKVMSDWPDSRRAIVNNASARASSAGSENAAMSVMAVMVASATDTGGDRSAG